MRILMGWQNEGKISKLFIKDELSSRKTSEMRWFEPSLKR